VSTGNNPLLQLRRFGVGFGSKTVLDGIDLDLPRGIHVLMGPVKTGKSTLMRGLSGHYDGHPLYRQWGDVLLDDKPLAAEHRPVLVQQHAKSLDQPVHAVVVQRLRSTRALSGVAWRNLAEELLRSHGLDSAIPCLDRSMMALPVLLQRQIGILSHCAACPPLLMIDEPTFGLPDIDAHRMIDWLRALGQYQPMLACLHHQQQAKSLGQSVTLLGGGHVLAHQATEQFFTSPANALVAHFLRTGSLGVHSLNARPEEVDGDLITSASASAVIPATTAAADTIHSSPPPASSPDFQTTNAKTQPASPAETRDTTPPKRQPAPLPMPSREGVEWASMVGQVFASAAQAPRGFHWIVPHLLAGCPEPGISHAIDYDLDLLRRAGVTTLVTLTERDLDQEALERHELKNIHLSIFDQKAPSLTQMHLLLARMQRLLQAKEVLAVHCKAGLGRTGTVLAAWLIRDGGLTASVAIERLRSIEKAYVQSAEQEAFLYAYEADLIARLSA